MKVLAVNHYPVFGGPHNRIQQLQAPLVRRGWETVVLLPDEPGNAAERLRSQGIQVFTMPLHRIRAARDLTVQKDLIVRFGPEIGSIRALIREQGIDLVWILGVINPHAGIAARLEGRPVVWQILDTRTPMLLRRALMPFVTRIADVIMTTGMEVARVHAGAVGMGARLVPFFPPVDTNLFRPDPKQRLRARAELGLGESDLVIGTIGNVNPMKGHRLFIRAAAVVRRLRPQTRFVILGATYAQHAAYTAGLWQEAADLGLRLGTDVIVRDAGARVAELAPAFDLFWLTSEPLSEGMPTALEEAMALGLPVVTTAVGSVREIVEEGIMGFIVPHGVPEATAGVTQPLLEDEELRLRMGLAGRQRAVARCAVEVCAEEHDRAFRIALLHRSGLLAAPSRGTPAPDGRRLSTLKKLLVCPACYGELTWSDSGIDCRPCMRVYPIIDGIPIMLLDQEAAEHDDLDHYHGPRHNGRPATPLGREGAAEFEITRPHGTPRLYEWLLSEKFRRSVAGIESSLSGATALTVCAGSGMDAEFLARAGARVIASDISLGAAQRTRARARRFGLSIASIVADVERLPFLPHSIDLVYVHDGLHHLQTPAVGLAEMARVAGHAVSVNEPARAAATALAVRFGWALEQEEAGNRVARMRPGEVASQLSAAGLRPLHRGRYAMYYQHEPGRLFALLSRPAALPVVISGWRLLNSVAGRFGNKLAVVATR